MKFLSKASFVLVICLSTVFDRRVLAEDDDNSWGWVIGGVVGAVGAVAAAPVAAAVLGFGSAGIGAGTLAAKAMSWAAVANGGGVASGSTVATLQAIGAKGALSAAWSAVAAGAGAIAGGSTGRKKKKN